MSESLEDKISDLKGLSIDRGQRPQESRFGWTRLLGLLILVVLISGAAGWWYYQTTGVNIVRALSEKPVDVELILVRDTATQSNSIALVASGRIVSDRRVNVATKVSGQITELLVEQGDHVEKDQVLARVEDIAYQAQRDEAQALLKRREHAIAEARSESVRAKASVQKAQADHDFELRNFRRLERLETEGRASEFEFLNAKNKYESADASLAVAMAAAESAAIAVDAAESDRAAAEAVLRRLQKRLDDCEILAPISGVILDRNAQVGDFLAAEGGRGANANAQLVSIADMTLLRVEIDVSERDIHRLFAEQRARITPDADRNRVFGGMIMWIDPLGDYAKATVQVKVRIENPEPSLRIEGSAKVEFLSRDRPTNTATARTFWLPKSAIKLTPGSDDGVVFTVTEARAIATPVKIGARTDRSVEVLSGVYEGMKIVAERVEELEDGSLVSISGRVQKEL